MNPLMTNRLNPPEAGVFHRKVLMI